MIVYLVGMPGAEVSNMAPPTVVLALHSVVLVCIVTLLDAPLDALLEAAGGVRYPVTVVGEGSPLLLLHGFTGRGASWAMHLPALARTHRVILVDLKQECLFPLHNILFRF